MLMLMSMLLFFLDEGSPEATFRFLGGFLSAPLASIDLVLLDDDPSPILPVMPLFLPLIPFVVVDEDAAVDEEEPLLVAEAVVPPLLLFAFAIDSFSDRCDCIISFRRFRASAGSIDIGVAIFRVASSISLSCLGGLQ